MLDLDEKSSQKVLNLASTHIPKFSFSQNPPQNATPMYQDIAKLLGLSDLYIDIKEKSIIKANELK